MLDTENCEQDNNAEETANETPIKLDCVIQNDMTFVADRQIGCQIF